MPNRDLRRYRSYWFGKGHTGYRSMAHLPVARGFSNHTGFLTGSQSYTSTARWQGDAPLVSAEYSTELFGDAALAALEAHDPEQPLFLYVSHMHCRRRAGRLLWRPRHRRSSSDDARISLSVSVSLSISLSLSLSLSLCVSLSRARARALSRALSLS